MTDNELIDLFASQLEAASAAGGWLYNANPYPVIQKNPATQEGIPTGPAIFFEKLFDVRYGWPEVYDSYNAPATGAPAGTQGTYTRTEKQWVESTFQVSALVIQDPTDLTVPTASDVVNYMGQYINSRQTITLFKPQGVSLLRVTQVRNPYFEDDRDGYEANPNFDVTFQHQRSITYTIGATNIVDGQVIAEITDNGIIPV